MNSAHRARNTIVGYIIAVLSFVLGASMAGATIGALIGWLGTRVLDLKVSTLLLFGVSFLFLLIAGGSIRWPQIKVLQVNRESPKALARKGPFLWGLATGAILGSGFATRIGFWIWYVVPAMAFLLGSQLDGALIYGTYGVTRAMMSIVLFMHGRTGASAKAWQDNLILSYFGLRKLSDVSLLLVAVVTFLATGLREVN